MIGLPSLQAMDRAQGARIWMASEATDMRCGFDRLAERVTAVIGEDPLSGHLFLFRSRRGDRLKILHWDRDGIRGVVQAARGRSIQIAASPRRSALNGVASQRVGDDPRRDRCFEAEARAAI